jgi:uncharacterized protein (TIGR00251 family)
MNIKETKEGVLLSVFVKPNSQTFRFDFNNGEIIIHATEEPEKGKANKEILKELTRLFHTKVEIVSGATSREKQLFIAGMTKDQLQNILSK